MIVCTNEGLVLCNSILLTQDYISFCTNIVL